MIARQPETSHAGRWLALLLALGGLLVADAPSAVSAPGPATASTHWSRSPHKAQPLGRRGCKPNCRGRTCGSDGCGGSCGKCGKNRVCVKNKCVGAPKGDPCKAMTGTWTGIMPATGTHGAQYLKGRIWGSRKACYAKFDVTYRKGATRAQVIEYFDVTLWGTKKARGARFTCTRLVYVRQRSGYSKDNFTGKLNLTHTLFKGKVLDASGATGAIILKKK